jgi:IS30 family transposase
MRTYTQLTQAQRYQIYALLKMGHSQTQIANCIGVDKSTISRELSRNRGQRGCQKRQIACRFRQAHQDKSSAK